MKKVKCLNYLIRLIISVIKSLSNRVFFINFTDLIKIIMSKTFENKKPKISVRKKKGVDMSAYTGKVKAFKNLNALLYQKKIRNDD